MNVLIAVVVPAATLFVYGLLFLRRVQAWHRYHDTRARREMLGHLALLIVAIGAAVSSALAISQAGTIDLRRAAAGIAFGSFLAAGVLFLVFRGPIGPVNGDGK